MKNLVLTFFAVILFGSSLAFAQIQKQGIKTAAQCTASGATLANCLPGTDQVYDLHNSQQLSVSIATGALGGGGGSGLPFGLNNLGLAASVASNAMTVAMKISDGSTDPSSGTPVSISFRSATVTSGGFSTVSQQSALSVVVPSGASLGEPSGSVAATYIYAQNNSGVVQLCVSASNSWDETAPQASTTISAGATSANVLYCTAGVTAPIRFIGKLLSTQTVAGTWAAAPSSLSLPTLGQGSTGAHYIGNITVGGCASQWSNNGGAAWASFPVVTGCTYTSDNGVLQSPSTMIPGFILPSYQAGVYFVTSNGAFTQDSTTQGNMFALWDGTNRSVSNPNVTVYTGPAWTAELVYTSTGGPVTIQIQQNSSNGQPSHVIATTPSTLTFSVYYYPTN